MIKEPCKFPGADEIWLSNEGLDRIPPWISSCKKLKHLVLSDNRIEKIEGLAGLENLASIYLQGNRIKKIEGITDLPSLRWLDLRFNPINQRECDAFKKKHRNKFTTSCTPTL